MKSRWNILGIEPTKDEKTIKRAYAKKLKQLDINNVQAFQELKDAFDDAREQIHEKEVIVVDDKIYVTTLNNEDNRHEELDRILAKFELVLYTTKGDAADELVSLIESLSIDEQVKYIQLLIDFIYRNQIRIYYEVGKYLLIRLQMELFQEQFDDQKQELIVSNHNYFFPLYINPDDVWWIHYRTFIHDEDDYFVSYVYFREELIRLIHLDYYTEVIKRINQQVNYDLWIDELMGLKMVATLLNGNLEDTYKGLLNDCKDMIINGNRHPLLLCSYLVLLNKDMRDFKLNRKDYVLNDYLILDYTDTGIRIDIDVIKRIDCIGNTKIVKSIDSYMNFYAKYNKHYNRLRYNSKPIYKHRIKSVNTPGWHVFLMFVAVLWFAFVFVLVVGLNTR